MIFQSCRETSHHFMTAAYFQLNVTPSHQVYDDNMFTLGGMARTERIDAAWVDSVSGGLTPQTGLAHEFSNSPTGICVEALRHRNTNFTID